MQSPTTRKRRTRRPVEDARDAILDAAETRLIASGPDAVRVQLVARDVGLTDAAVHYHFGNREGLMEALLRRAGRQLRDELTRLAAQWDSETLDVDALVQLFEDCYDRRQFARLTAWLSLHGWRPAGAGMLRELAESFHSARVARCDALGATQPRLEDTLFLLELVNLTVWAKALIGASTHRMVGLAIGRSKDVEFRAWFAELVTDRATRAEPRYSR